VLIDDQEVLSRKYSDDLVLLLPLASGRIAVLNSARELCGYLDVTTAFADMLRIRIGAVWRRPTPTLPISKHIDLADLGLL